MFCSAVGRDDDDDDECTEPGVVLGLDDGGQEGEVVAGSVVGVPGVNVLREQDDDEESEEEWLQLQRLHLGGYDVGLTPRDWVQTDDRPVSIPDGNDPHIHDDDPHDGGFRGDRDGSRRGLQQMFCMSLR